MERRTDVESSDRRRACRDVAFGRRRGWRGSGRPRVPGVPRRLVDDLLELSHVARAAFLRQAVDLSDIVRTVGARLRRESPQRQLELVVAAPLPAQATAGC